MRRLLCVLIVCCSMPLFAADKGRAHPVVLDLRSVSVSELIQLVYGDCLDGAYVIDPGVLSDKRVLSVRVDSGRVDFVGWWRAFLSDLGYVVNARSGVDYIILKSSPYEKLDVFVYRPLYRDVNYLSSILTPLVRPGTMRVQGAGVADVRGVQNPGVAPGGGFQADGGASAFVDRNSDVLVFQGSKEDILRIKKFLPQIDLPSGEVIVNAVVYEVQTSDIESSGVALALSVLGGKLGLSIGQKTGLAGDSVSVHTAGGSIDAVIGALRGDSRFRVVSSPRVRVRSGASGKITVGQDVPTLGAVSFSGNGSTPVQSVEYQSSGVILEVKPVVHDGGIDLTVLQQISDFAQTTNGVNASPTRTKRELTSSITVMDGELVVLGGLTQDKSSANDSGQSWLPSWMHTRGKDSSKVEIVLVLSVSRVKNTLT